MSHSISVAPEDLAERIDGIRERINAACRRAGRRQEEVVLVGVTKTFPVEVVQAAREAGLEHVSENKVQELLAKAEAAPGKISGGDLVWHMIGHLQRNKARDAVRYADIVQSLDSLRLANELNKRAREAGRIVPCFVQVNISGEATKSGVEPDETHALIDSAATFDHVRITGLMGIASFTENMEQVRREFVLLRRLRDAYRGRADLACLSMGMTSDFEVAIEEGATHIRIGSALFGPRD